MSSNNEEAPTPKGRAKISFADIQKDARNTDEISNKNDNNANKRESLPSAEGDSLTGDEKKSHPDARKTLTSNEDAKDENESKKSEQEKVNVLDQLKSLQDRSKDETQGKGKGRKDKTQRKNQTEKEPKNKRKQREGKRKQTEDKYRQSKDKDERKESEDKHRQSKDKGKRKESEDTHRQSKDKDERKESEDKHRQSKDKDKRKESEDKHRQSEDKHRQSEDKHRQSEDKHRQSEDRERKYKKDRSRSADIRRFRPSLREDKDKYSDDEDVMDTPSFETILAEEDGEKEEVEGEDYQVITKRFYHGRYGEEFMGEGYYYASPSPSDEYMLTGRKDTAASDKKSAAGKDVEYEGEVHGTLEEEEKEEELVIEQLVGKAKAEVAEKTSIATIGSFDYGTRISEYFIQQKVKTPSEIKFENEYREAIEEKIKKSMHPIEKQEEIIQDRKPVEKKKILLNELDMSGLYPQPKVIVSEISFAFDEDEEGEKAGRGTQTDVDVIMELLRQSLRQDVDSIFAKNAKDSINKVRNVVEEVLTIMKRGIPIEVAQKVNESLPNFKNNLKINLIFYLQQTLETIKSREEEEEDKPAEMAEKKTKKTRRKAKIKSKKTEETLKEDTEGEIEEGEVEELKTEAEPKDEVDKLIKKRKALEKVEEEGEGREEEEEETEEEEEEAEESEEAEEEPVIPYEKIDWNAYLTESERQLSIDPRLRSEMELYIAEKKKELIAEQERKAGMKKKKMLYRKIKDQQELLRIINLNVTMKFVLNNGNIFTCAYRYFMPFKEIKEDLAGIFKVPPELFVIYRDDIEVKDDQTAYHLVPPVEPFDTVTFRLIVAGTTQHYELKSDFLDIPVPDIITCCIETGKDHNGVPEYKEVVVEIENRQIKKPYVGGYRDRCTGTEYHHAFSQSGPPPSKLPPDQRASRDTQTITENDKLIDTTSHKATQMARRDYYVSTENDKIITAKPYIDYDTLSKKTKFNNKVKTIQRYVRAMILRRYLKEMSEEYRKRKCWEIEEEKKRILERENRIKSDIINMTYPKTKADFDMLYALVEKWRRAQIKRISELKTEAPKKAELCGVLEKEIKLLEAIEIHRIAVRKKQKEIKAINFMKKLSTPITWTGYRGMTIKMDTLKTQRARELKELYQSLSRHDLPYQDRIELLISLKHALRIHNTTLTEELINLINQECEMLIRGVSPKSLEYLRQRIEHLFKEYFKDPYFNPEAAKYDPMFHKGALKNMVFCKMCHQMKHMKDFTASTRSKGFHVCAACHWIYNIAVPRIDLGPYRYILKLVRKDEQKRNCYSSCVFVLQDEDMRFLVQNIWMNKSIVSENDNVIDLRMPRWDVHKDWSPWNCILLTELEAKAHLKTNPYDNFEDDIIGEIVSKHELARSHFKQLYTTTNKIEDSGKWANAVDLKQYVPPLITGDLHDLTSEECLKLKTGSLYEVHEWPMGNDTMKSKMEIDPTTQRDAGYYECQADNQYAIDRRGFRTDYVIYTY